MNHSEILSHLIDSPASDVLYAITMQQVITAIVHRMGDSALSLTAIDLQVLREEVEAVIQHTMDCRDAIDEGIEAFQIVRNL